MWERNAEDRRGGEVKKRREEGNEKRKRRKDKLQFRRSKTLKSKWVLLVSLISHMTKQVTLAILLYKTGPITFCLALLTSWGKDQMRYIQTQAIIIILQGEAFKLLMSYLSLRSQGKTLPVWAIYLEYRAGYIESKISCLHIKPSKGKKKVHFKSKKCSLRNKDVCAMYRLNDDLSSEYSSVNLWAKLA